MTLTPPEAAVRAAFEYLYLRGEVGEVAADDLVVGFGHFDPKIPARCCELARRHPSSLVLFTGGIGAGTADLGKPEALFFADEARRLDPELDGARLVIESASTNTNENILMSLTLLARRDPPVLPGQRLRRAWLVANAYRQRRVFLTCRKLLPEVALVNAPPETTFEREHALFAAKGQDLTAHIRGEIERIATYGARGWIAADVIPDGVAAAFLPAQPESPRLA
jgi:hypothetical protein